jgi:fermentation-respiration switch protein FrsA (DUF1100 family)
MTGTRAGFIHGITCGGTVGARSADFNARPVASLQEQDVVQSRIAECARHESTPQATHSHRDYRCLHLCFSDHGNFSRRTALHLKRRPLHHSEQFEANVEQQFRARVEVVSIGAYDNVILSGWYVHPQDANGRSVILLHGVTDNREGVSGYALMFLHHGYSVLMPDSREHGESGGDIATYGVRERDDVLRWSDWLKLRTRGCIYLFGESMGAAIALQASAIIPQLCATAVESPYSTFREIAYDRISQQTHLGSWFPHTIARPTLEFALMYAQVRYEVSLEDSNPSRAIYQSKVPILIICGTADRNISMRHSLLLAKAGESHVQLWIVSGADHGGAVRVAPKEFEDRVTGWFQIHSSSRLN